MALLSAFSNVDWLSGSIVPRAQWHPFPTADDRSAWDALPVAEREGCVAAAETQLAAPWPELPATLYLKFARTGDRHAFETPYFRRRCHVLALAIGECVEGRGRFLDALADGLWGICEESTWCLPAHVREQRAGSGLPDTAEPVPDLFAAETGALLAWTHYLLGPQLAGVSPLLPERIRRETALRVLAPVRDCDHWGWQGFRGQKVNNWNPWINSNVLACLLLLEHDPTARATLLAKTLRSLDCFLTGYPSDGGCDEGPGYWSRAGASVFDCLDLLDSATAGKLTVWDQPLVAAMGRFICHAHLANRWFVNFADAPARLTPDAALVHSYGKRVGDADLMAFGASFRRKPGLRRYDHITSAGRLLRELFDHDALAAATACAPLWRDTWLPIVQVWVARSHSGSTSGLVAAAKGGHNAESHNHNDVGSFVVYAEGRPLLVDVGVETYRRETFSKDRYNIWTMQSQFHNLPTVNGAQQLPGEAFRASVMTCSQDDRQATLELDLAAAYAPEANLVSWSRRLHLERGGALTVTDRYRCHTRPRELFLSLMTPCVPRLGPGVIELDERALPSDERTGTGRIAFDAAALQPFVEILEVTDNSLRKVWGDRLYRVVLRAVTPGITGQFTLHVTARADHTAAPTW